MNKIKIVFLILSISISSQTFCAEFPKWRQIFNDSNFDSNSKENRHIVAEGLLEHLKQLNAYIPNLKPYELQWLEQENESLNKLKGEAWAQKMMKIEWTPENHTKRIKEKLNNIIGSLNEIVLNKKLTLQQEVMYWAHVVLILMEDEYFNESLTVLIKSGRINLTDEITSNMMLVREDDMWLLYKFYGKSIQATIVLPYLMDKIKK